MPRLNRREETKRHNPRGRARCATQRRIGRGARSVDKVVRCTSASNWARVRVAKGSQAQVKRLSAKWLNSKTELATYKAEQGRKMPAATCGEASGNGKVGEQADPDKVAKLVRAYQAATKALKQDDPVVTHIKEQLELARKERDANKPAWAVQKQLAERSAEKDQAAAAKKGAGRQTPGGPRDGAEGAQRGSR